MSRIEREKIKELLYQLGTFDPETFVYYSETYDELTIVFHRKEYTRTFDSHLRETLDDLGLAVKDFGLRAYDDHLELWIRLRPRKKKKARGEANGQKS